MTRSLVTGASGFIGRRLVQELLDRGEEVVCLSHRATNRPDFFDHPSITNLVADVRDREAIAGAMKHVDRVFHLAAAVATKTLEQSHSVNVLGTENLAKAAAAETKVPVFVYVSSLAAAGPSNHAVTEVEPCKPVSHYGRTKLEAETKLSAIAASLPVTIVRPPCVFGPGDRNLLALYQTIVKGWNVVLSKDFRYSYLSVDDLVIGMLDAAESGKRVLGPEDAEKQGLYYLTDPQAVTFPELAELIAETLGGVKVRHLKIPKSVGWIAGAFGEAALRFAGRRAFLNFDKIREGLGGSWVCDGGRAEKELAFTPSADLRSRLQATTDFYKQSQWL